MSVTDSWKASLAKSRKATNHHKNSRELRHMGWVSTSMCMCFQRFFTTFNVHPQPLAKNMSANMTVPNKQKQTWEPNSWMCRGRGLVGVHLKGILLWAGLGGGQSGEQRTARTIRTTGRKSTKTTRITTTTFSPSQSAPRPTPFRARIGSEFGFSKTRFGPESGPNSFLLKPVSGPNRVRIWI